MKKILLTLATIVACIFAADAQIFLRGGMNNWEAQAEWEFSTVDGVNYELKNVVIPADASFKVASEDWATVDYGSYSKSVIGKWNFLTYGGPNIYLDYSDALEAHVDVYFNLEFAALAIVWAGEEVGPVPSEEKPEVYDIYLRGSMNDWAAIDEWKFKYKGDNQYALENVKMIPGENFKLADADWSVINYGLGHPFAVGTTETLDYDGSNIILIFPDAVLPVNLYFDLNTKELTISYIEIPDIYLRGDINGWGVSDEYKFTTEDYNYYILENVYIPDYSQFKIADENWSVVNYGCESPLLLNYLNELSLSGSNMWIYPKDGVSEVYNLYFNFMDATLVVTSSTLQIDSTITEDTTPIYYTLQGIRINNPEPGNLYLVKSGTKVHKTIIR